jgi:hypothetical protein
MMTSGPSALLAAALFSFHSNFWLNLHHFVRAVARGEPAVRDMSASEKRGWDAAVALYRERYAQRNLLFDEGMVAIKESLRRAETRQSLVDLGLDPALQQALESAAPAYRRHFWPQHDRDNRDWIAKIEAPLAAYGAPLAARIAAVYGKEWPAQPIDVDLSVQAGPFGAYTTSGPPTHVVISSVDPRYRAPYALEMLFHEASHGWDDVLTEGIARAAKAQRKTPPPQLWHALLFFTAGELTGRTTGDEDYVEHALRSGVYDRACGGCRALLLKHWGPRLDGRVSIDEALSALVAALPATEQRKNTETQRHREKN